ncbi:MAG: hypothetical protein JXB07_19300 [Anaerolineae bacterium]|nr:hypothetical protein [Anaerolineae bacterium]
MTKKESEVVALQRPHKPRRRFRWWLLILGVLTLVLLGGLGYLFQYRIADWFKPVPTLAPTPSGGGAPGVLYSSDFEDPDVVSDWEIFKDGFIRSEITEGRLVVGVNALADTGAWSGLGYTFDDFVLDVDATKLEGPDDNGIIIVFRAANKENYNRFDISSDGYYSVSKMREGIQMTVSGWNISSAIQTGGANNHIRLTAIGDTFRFEVNGVQLKLCTTTGVDVKPLWDRNNPDQCLGGDLVDAWQDSDLPGGRIGLGAQGIVGSDGESTTSAVATIGFDNLVIKSP